MKRVLISFAVSILFVVTLALSACGYRNDTSTYYPDKDEMTQNMQAKGYKTYSTDWLGGNGTGTFFSAEKDSNYIKVYWLDDSDDCEYCYNELQKSYPDCEVLVQIENDDKFGNIVYCGTSAAVSDSGIKVVKVDVDVKV